MNFVVKYSDMKNSKMQIKRNKCVVFFDFDNTITKHDVFDDMLVHFSRDKHWIKLEEKWKNGKIGSRECLEGQLKGIRISKAALSRYLSGIRLDPYFKKIIKLFKIKKIKTIILSDNFDYILKKILKFNAVQKLNIYANKLRFAKNRLLPHFPFESKICKACGHCKTKNLLANVDKNSIIFFVGDGCSDICPAQYADIVFAKEDLLNYYKDKKFICVPYKGLKDVYNYFIRSLR